MLLDNVLIAAIPLHAWKKKGGAREKRDLIKLAIKMPVGRAQARRPLRPIVSFHGGSANIRRAESRLLIATPENERARFYYQFKFICVIRRCFEKLLFLLASIAVDPLFPVWRGREGKIFQIVNQSFRVERKSIASRYFSTW